MTKKLWRSTRGVRECWSPGSSATQPLRQRIWYNQTLPISFSSQRRKVRLTTRRTLLSSDYLAVSKISSLNQWYRSTRTSIYVHWTSSRPIKIIWPNIKVNYSHSVWIKASAKICLWVPCLIMIGNRIYDLKVSRRPSCQWLITHSLALQIEAELTEMSRIGVNKWSVIWKSNHKRCLFRTSRYQDPSSKRVSLMCTRNATLFVKHQLKMTTKVKGEALEA